MAVTPAQGIELSDRKSSTAFSGEISQFIRIPHPLVTPLAQALSKTRVAADETFPIATVIADPLLCRPIWREEWNSA
jgi:hypothetical protein